MMKKRILAVEPYYGGSHKAWLDGLARQSRHEFCLLTLPARKWKWRMRGAAMILAEEFRERFEKQTFDGLLVSDMLNLSDFVAFTRPTFSHCPAVVYMHENQISYPLHEEERVDYQYAITNLTSGMAATKVVFNSEYNRGDFFRGIRWLLSKMPDCQPSEEQLNHLETKSVVISPGVDLKTLNVERKKNNDTPIVLWNHRWDRDKRPEKFVDSLMELHKRKCDFRVIVCGEKFRNTPLPFQTLKDNLGEKIVHLGFVKSRDQYTKLLAQSDLVVSTAIQEFFGISVVEAVYAGAFPILPKRLNYPHLIPNEYHNDVFYEEGELALKLEEAVGKARKNELPSMSDYMVQYDWGNIISYYDELFE